MSKTFKTIEEQLQILKEKGLVITNEEKTKEILIRENYFFLVGYRHLFLNPDKKNYINGTTFEEIHALFCFDRQFRNILFKNFLIVENNIKSIISYQLSKKYGYKEDEYLKPASFSNDPDKFNQINDVINKVKRQVRSNCLKHSATSHYVNKYGYIPLWILVKVLSFGLVADVYGILKHPDQEAIASYYELDVNELEKYLTILSNYRNLCAHEDIVYNNKTLNYIPDTKYHHILNIEKFDEEFSKGKNDIFSVIIMLKSLLTNEAFSLMINEITMEMNKLDYKVNTIQMQKVLEEMGFPSNWKEIKEI